MVCYVDSEYPVDGQKDEGEEFTKGGIEKRFDNNDKEKENCYFGVHIEIKWF